MRIEYEKKDDRYFIYCKFHENFRLEELDKRWNKKRRAWLVYNSRINRDIIKSLTFDQMPENVKDSLYETEIKVDEIEYIYKTEPLPFQIPATKKLLSLPHGALFSPVGSGKSKIAIDVGQSLWHAGKINKILIIGLVSIIENWKIQLEKHWRGDIPWGNIAITGVESYSQGNLYSRVMAWVDDKTFIIIDESSKIKNNKATRTERITKLGEAVTYKIIMTGSPLLNCEIDLYAQYNFLNPEIIGISTHVGFKNRYCIKGGYEGKKIIGYKRQEELMNNLAPYTFVISKEEAMPHLPSQTFETRNVQLNEEQRRLISRVKKEMISEWEGGERAIKNVLTKMLRISQIAGGFTEDRMPVDGENQKLKAIKDIIEECPDEQIVIFVRFIPELEMLQKELGAEVIRGVKGGVSKEERQKILNKFQKGEFKYLVCQYQSGAMGLDMDAARISIFYSFDFSLEMWIQSIGRIARTTQTRPMLYYSLLATGSIDKYIYDTLQNKEDIAESVKKMLADGGISAESLF